MSAKLYHKLVRDRIPEIIEADGKTCICETLSHEEYLRLLDEKLNEELAEYQESKSLEKLADLLEVMQAVVKARGWTEEELEQVRADKAAKRGGFEKKILLKEVCAPSDYQNLVFKIPKNQETIIGKFSCLHSTAKNGRGVPAQWNLFRYGPPQQLRRNETNGTIFSAGRWGGEM